MPSYFGAYLLALEPPWCWREYTHNSSFPPGRSFALAQPALLLEISGLALRLFHVITVIRLLPEFSQSVGQVPPWNCNRVTSLQGVKNFCPISCPLSQGPRGSVGPNGHETIRSPVTQWSSTSSSLKSKQYLPIKKLSTHILSLSP